MKGTIGGTDASGDFYCRACIDAHSWLKQKIVSYIHTMTRGSFICNKCNTKVDNVPHLESASCDCENPPPAEGVEESSVYHCSEECPIHGEG